VVSTVSSQCSIRTPRNRAPRSLSLVIPCYNEEEVLPELRKRLKDLVAQYSFPVEVVLVDDGSKDNTWPLICQYAHEDSFIKSVRLARNFGHQTAITCGLDQTRGEVVAILDADLQDPPELIPEMIDAWKDGFDVVYGQRKKREGESLSKKFFAFAFYRIFEKVAGLRVPRDTGDFRLMDRRAVDALQSLRERHRFVRGMVSWIGYHQKAIQYDRPERFAGVTKYPFRKSLFLAIDAITSFTYAPLRIASYLGFATSMFAFLYIGVVLVLKICGINFPGYTSIMAAILLLGGVQLSVLGILGEYIGRIFEQGQQRPLYLVDQIQGEPLEHTSDMPRSAQS
jgi:glycosyltransferase involved in cell wall biosynthesis